MQLTPTASFVRYRRLQRGVSMIEALVALLVLALGIMGLAAIQTRTLVESRASNERAVAIRMAEDLNERMQLNSAVKFATPAPDPHPYVVTWGAAAAGTDCLAAACTGVQLASYDIQQWKTALGQLLPGGDARGFRSTTDGNQFGVLIGWREVQAKNQGSAGTSELAQYTDRFTVDTGVNGITCPAGLVCHLVYIRP